MNKFRVRNLKTKNEEDAIDAIKAGRNIKVTPRGMTVAVLIEESVYNRGPVTWIVLIKKVLEIDYILILLIIQT